ncbi:MAG: phenylalanine 4-monooxygenase [Phycisphaerales bacterium]|nr:phenylalanine 4-monooxygenase [Phycisphaerales bacterium]
MGMPDSSAQKFAGSLNSAMIDGAQARAAQQYADRFGEPGFTDITNAYIDQQYQGYSAENQETWRNLHDRQMDYLQDQASATYLSGAQNINLVRDHIPYLEGPKSINTYLRQLTGWQSKAVPGYLKPHAFFGCLARREFPTTVVIRPKESIDYLPEPDIFHDVFGHVPLHADPTFADFLQTYGKAALATDDPIHTERLARLFWFTVEFGLIKESGRHKLYGSGLISSPGESRHALTSSEVDRRPFDMERVCSTSFEIDHYQPILYVLESFEQLRDAMNSYANRLLDAAKTGESHGCSTSR